MGEEKLGQNQFHSKWRALPTMVIFFTFIVYLAALQYRNGFMLRNCSSPLVHFYLTTTGGNFRIQQVWVEKDRREGCPLREECTKA